MLFGMMSPSFGHTKRMCRILRSEWYRQVRWYKDWLRVMCDQDVHRRNNRDSYRDWCKTSKSVTETLWNWIRPQLPARKKQASSEGRFLNLSDVSVPEKIQQVLQKGPKFSVEPTLRPEEKIATARTVSKLAKEEERYRCVTECVQAVSSNVSDGSRKLRVQPVVKFCLNNQLRVLISDKEGFFVIINELDFLKKAEEALERNFKPLSVKSKEVKTRAISLLKRLNLEKLGSSVEKAKGVELELFYSIKTHKPEMPLRAIVSERDTWQLVVSQYLQEHLSALRVNDPFHAKNSGVVVEYLNKCECSGVTAFSLDVVDLYYSLPHDQLLNSVEQCIVEDNDEISFRNSTGISTQSFLEILTFYLKSTFVVWLGNLYMQKSGVCIGSSVAPVLSQIFLGKVDAALSTKLQPGTKVFRYVDDYLIIIKKCSAVDVESMKACFEKEGMGLRFTSELPKDNKLQFLDLSLFFGDKHLCWRYNPRSAKPVLDYSSGHSKLVKRGIVMSCLRSALGKCCLHTLQSGFVAQLERLIGAGYPSYVIASVCEKLLRTVKNNEKRTCTSSENKEENKKRAAVIPYIHKMAHGLKNVGNRFGVRVVFSAPNKLASICSMVHRRAHNASKGRGCLQKHVTKFVKCITGVVYKIPLSCGRMYIGQTGRCVNVRLREHRSSLKNTPYSHLASHCVSCKCQPLFENTIVLFRHPHQTTREISEAYHISRNTDQCISHPSLSLLDCEFSYLDNP